MDAEERELLREIRRRLARIERWVKPRRCTPRDRERLALVLPVIAGRRGSEPFLVAEIMSDPALRKVAGGSAGSLGILLSRACHDRATVAQLLVERMPKEHGARLWRVVRRLR